MGNIESSTVASTIDRYCCCHSKTEFQELPRRERNAISIKQKTNPVPIESITKYKYKFLNGTPKNEPPRILSPGEQQCLKKINECESALKMNKLNELIEKNNGKLIYNPNDLGVIMYSTYSPEILSKDEQLRRETAYETESKLKMQKLTEFMEKNPGKSAYNPDDLDG